MRCRVRRSREPQPELAEDDGPLSRSQQEGLGMKATLTVLGSGTSMGVPTLGCTCAVCQSSDPRDRRTRPSIMLEYAAKVVLIDTTPDFYAQAIREQIRRVDAVFFTHTHADHILGIDDLRPLSYAHKPKKLPLYARPDAAAFLRRMFSYIFDSDYKYGGLPQLELRPIDGPVEIFGACFEPVRLIHGETEIYGFRFGKAAYLTVKFRKRRSVSWKAWTFFSWMPYGISLIRRIRRWRIPCASSSE
jgi:phosphoribosyl 1,2-cyclic phosphate phosphodiesterase